MLVASFIRECRQQFENGAGRNLVRATFSELGDDFVELRNHPGAALFVREETQNFGRDRAAARLCLDEFRNDFATARER